MKLIRNIFIAGLILSVVTTTASAQSFREGSNVGSVGIGLGSALLSSGAYSSSTPGISLQFEHGQWEVGGPGTVSLGGYIGFKSFKYSSGSYDLHGNAYTFESKWSYTVIGVRSAYHYNGLKDEKFDPYGGVMLSYNILSYSDNYSGLGNYNASGVSGIGLTIYVGGRYYVADKLAVFGELGYGISFLTIGAAYNF